MTNWQSHLEEEILPWWVEHGVDDTQGVLTCFDNGGLLVETTKYTWSQGRWAWLAAELADEAARGRLSVDKTEWSKRSVETAAFLTSHALTGDGRTAFRTTRDGVQLSGPCGEVSTSVFADLFTVMGLAGAIRQRNMSDTSSSDWIAQASLILKTAHASIQDGSALSEPYPVPDGYRDLAGPMTLLHASSEFLRGVPDNTEAREAQQWSLNELLGPNGFLGESSWWEFRPLSNVVGDTMLAHHRTPGHLIELCWMIIHAATQAQERGEDLSIDVDQLARLATEACRIGWDAQDGGMLRYVDAKGGKPAGHLLDSEPGPYEELVLSTWDTKLWWVHSEAMYGTTLLAEMTGDSDLISWSRELNSYTMSTFPEKGSEWIQIRSRNGQPLNSVVALPVKDPMHIARSLLFLNRIDKTQGK